MEVYGVNNQGKIKTVEIKSFTKCFFTPIEGFREKFRKDLWQTDSWYFNFYKTKEEAVTVLRSIKERKKQELEFIESNLKKMMEQG